MDENTKTTLLKVAKASAWAVISVGLIVAAFFLFAIPFNAYVLYNVFDYGVEKLINVTGLSQFLIKAVVILALIPAVWVIPNLFRGKRKREARAIVMLYIGCFYLAAYVFSKDIYFARSGDHVLKYYALTPEGVKFYDTQGIDPVYGITLKPVTPEIIRNLRLLQKGEFKPVDPRHVQFFNPITGEAQIWFYRHTDGSYDFYDKPGYHPITGDRLSPITREIYFDWEDRYKKLAKTVVLDNDIAEAKKIEDTNKLKNGNFTQRYDGWERKIGDITQGVSTTEVINFAQGRSGKALHLKHEGNGNIQFSQVVDIEDVDQLFSISFQMKSHEGMIFGFTGTGVGQVGLQYLDAEGSALGETILLNYQKNPFADTALIGVPRRDNDSYKRHYVEIANGRFHHDYKIAIKKELEDNLLGINIEGIKKVAVIIWCGANHAQAGSELWVADISLTKNTKNKF